MTEDVTVKVPLGQVDVSFGGVVRVPLQDDRYILAYPTGRIEIYSDDGDGIGVGFDIPKGIECDRIGKHVIDVVPAY